MRVGESEREREREEEQGALKKHCVLCWQALQSNPLAVQRCCFFFLFSFFFFFSRGPAFAIWYSNAEETGGELLPDHPQNRQGLVKEHQLGQQDAGPVHVQGDVRQLTHTGVDLVLFTRVTRSLSLSHTHTHTHTNAVLSHRGSHAYAVTCFPILWQLSKNNSKIPLDFLYFRASGYGLSIRYEDRRREM